MKIPYLQTSIQQDLLTTLALTPLWWFLGFNVFIYQLTAGLVLIKLMAAAPKRTEPLGMNSMLIAFALFLVSYVISVWMNRNYYASQRIWASLNNYSLFMMGFLICFVIYNVPFRNFSGALFKAARAAGVMTGVIAVIFLAAWYFHLFAIDTQSLLARFFPSLQNYPFFYILWQIQGVEVDWSLGNFPRLGIYSSANIATGGYMAIILPLLAGSFSVKEKRSWFYYFILAIAFVPLFFSLSRTAICAFVTAVIFVKFLSANGKLIWGVILLGLTALSGNYLYEGFQWILSLRAHSNEGRFGIYQEALHMVMRENPFMGIGVRPRDEFSSMIVGSHSHYIELLLVTGIIGLVLFLIFQWGVLLVWYQQRKYLKDESSKMIWKVLGTSYIAANGVVLTSGLGSMPFISFAFYVVAGSILAFARSLREESLIAAGAQERV